MRFGLLRVPINEQLSTYLLLSIAYIGRYSNRNWIIGMLLNRGVRYLRYVIVIARSRIGFHVGVFYFLLSRVLSSTRRAPPFLFTRQSSSVVVIQTKIQKKMICTTHIHTIPYNIVQQ